VNADPEELAGRLAEVRGRIEAAARRAGRAPGAVRLIGAVKTLPYETIAAVVRLGLLDLGENRVQEAEVHERSVGRTAATWHMIGHLQRNKAARALELFDCVHGVDDAELGEAIARRGREEALAVEAHLARAAGREGRPRPRDAGDRSVRPSPH